ncbi:Ku protein [Streptomyces sp. HPF1205]|uniref:non-homologous end joining protein Ku n=1 Tax=Streptomyces sp. HPF1205 TaxID=2873262 RepID=UPI001CEC731E|nr:Ku protein [Streptomyces sp. HPF1205]
MPPIAQFTLTFGLVAIPVRVLGAVTSHKVAFRQIHLDDHGRVRYRKICEQDEQVLEPDDIGRAWEAPDGRLVEITDEEMDHLPLPTAKTIEINGFLDLARVPGEMFAQPYFLTPQSPAANKPYVLMRDALARSGKAAVGKYTLRGSGEALGLIHPQGDVLVLQRLRWPDEIRAADDAAPRGDVALGEDELQAALAYIDALGDLDMATMHDEYAAAVQELVTAKAEHRAPPHPARPEEEAAGVTDLMTALQRATEQARADREHPGEVHHMADRKPAKKTARATAKKTTGKGAEQAPQKAPARATEKPAKKAAKKQPAKKTAKKTTRKRAG